LVIILVSTFFVVGLFLAVGSVSFWLQRGSKVRDLFQSFFLVFGSYPPDIFQRDKVLFVLISCVGLYPAVFLPYWMMSSGEGNLLTLLLLVVCSIGMLALGFFIFNRGLKRYSSGNLVLQM
jgi:ABC-2 type transport system permease protein